MQGDFWSFSALIKSVGWNFSIRVKEAAIFKPVYEHFWYSLLFFSLAILLTIIAVIVVSGKFSRSLGTLMKRCQRIERLNFQPAPETNENIEEIRQLSHTLNHMSLTLDSHYTIKEDVRIAEAIRQHALPNSTFEIKGFQVEYSSNAGRGLCGEMFDIVRCGKDQGIAQEDNDIAFLLLDDADNGIDAAVKNGQLRAIFRSMVKQGKSLSEIAQIMNDYLLADMTLHGPVQLSLGTLDLKHAIFSTLNLGQNGVFHYSEQNFHQYNGYQQALAMQTNLSGLRVKNIAISVGDMIVICSDGVLVAQNQQRELFGANSIERIIQQNPQQSAQDLIQSLQIELQHFTEKAYLQTERSIIVLKRC